MYAGRQRVFKLCVLWSIFFVRYQLLIQNEISLFQPSLSDFLSFLFKTFRLECSRCITNWSHACNNGPVTSERGLPVECFKQSSISSCRVIWFDYRRGL